MAITVVHGVIALSGAVAGSGERDTSAGEVDTNSPPPSSPLQPQANQELCADATVGGDLPPRIQMALERLKSYSAGRVREELRDLTQAEELANGIALRLVLDHEGAHTAHAELAAEAAEEHLMQ